jgi:hypothetical protein
MKEIVEQRLFIYDTFLKRKSLRKCQRNFHRESVFNGFLNPELMIYSDEPWFTLSGYVNSRNNRHWSTEILRTVHEGLVHGVKFGVWSAVSARRITGTLFFKTNAERCVRLILTPFF